MQVIENSYKIIYPSNNEEWIKEAKFIEMAGRNCYKSEIKENSWKEFLPKLKKMKHMGVFEFGNIILQITCDRFIQTEIVRHRLASYCIESTRYVNYENGLRVIEPESIKGQQLSKEWNDWYMACDFAEGQYQTIVKDTKKKDLARTVLPGSVAGDIMMKCNFRELMHIFDLRCSPRAHADIRKIFTDIREECIANLPEVFS